MPLIPRGENTYRKFHRPPRRKLRGFLLAAIFLILCYSTFTSLTLADDSSKSVKSDVRIPEGMMTIKIGDTYVVVPKDGRVRHEGSIYFIETADEYAARKAEALNALQKRVESLEQKQQSLEKEIEKMKASQGSKAD